MLEIPGGKWVIMENKRYGFGVDIGGTTIKMGLFLEDGSLIEKWEIPTDKTNEGSNILDDISRRIYGNR